MQRRVACYCVSGASYELAIAAFQNVTDTCVCAHVLMSSVCACVCESGREQAREIARTRARSSARVREGIRRSEWTRFMLSLSFSL